MALKDVSSKIITSINNKSNKIENLYNLFYTSDCSKNILNYSINDRRFKIKPMSLQNDITLIRMCMICIQRSIIRGLL